MCISESKRNPRGPIARYLSKNRVILTDHSSSMPENTGNCAFNSVSVNHDQSLGICLVITMIGCCNAKLLCCNLLGDITHFDKVPSSQRYRCRLQLYTCTPWMTRVSGSRLTRLNFGIPHEIPNAQGGSVASIANVHIRVNSN